jgi:HSP20 family protein
MRELMLDPLRELERFAGGRYPTTTEAGFVPAFDLKETKDAYVLKGELPGVKEQDLDISLQGDRLTVSGTRQEEKREERDTYFTYEMWSGSFSRSFALPENVDVDHTSADLKNGVLTVLLPKKIASEPKKITVGQTGKAKA